MDNLKLEIAQQAPFQSAEEQALLNLIRTADSLNRALQRKIRPWGITATQYNVLRILRGSHPRGLTCSAIGDRMLTEEPDITRLLKRLKSLKLIHQHRDRDDRRMTWTQISPEGLKLLEEMDPMIEQGPVELLGHLDPAELTELIRLLEKARHASGDSRAEPQCEGKSDAVSCDGKSGRPTLDGK